MPAGHDQHPGAVFAYRLGGIEEGVHNAPLGHSEVPFDDFLAGLIADARAEFPDAEWIGVERLVQTERGDGGVWISGGEFDPRTHTALTPGMTLKREVTVRSEHDAAAGR